MDVAELMERLARGEPTIVLDIRPAEQRREWSIPGSRWVDTFAALQVGDTSPIDALDLEDDIPIVTVCARGITAMKVTAHLSAKGHRVQTLEGGMNAWNKAWNLAETKIPTGSRIIQVRRTGRGCLSHLLVNEGEALVVDAGVDPVVYEQVAQQVGARIVGVLDTHIHADHLSRAPSIARRLGVPYHLGRSTVMETEYAAVDEGDEIPFGADRIKAIHTPGHTWESITYQAGDVLFTGDTLFVDGVGRPDLGAGKTETRDRAFALHDSIQRIMAHDAATRVLPAHASRPLPFDGVQWSASLAQVRAQVDLLDLDPETFVTRIEARLGDVPPTYHRMVDLNRKGAWTEEDATVLEAGANRCATVDA